MIDAIFSLPNLIDMLGTIKIGKSIICSSITYPVKYLLTYERNINVKMKRKFDEIYIFYDFTYLEARKAKKNCKKCSNHAFITMCEGYLS